MCCLNNCKNEDGGGTNVSVTIPAGYDAVAQRWVPERIVYLKVCELHWAALGNKGLWAAAATNSKFDIDALRGAGAVEWAKPSNA